MDHDRSGKISSARAHINKKKTIFEQTFSYLALVAVWHRSYIEIFLWKKPAVCFMVFLCNKTDGNYIIDDCIDE